MRCSAAVPAILTLALVFVGCGSGGDTARETGSHELQHRASSPTPDGSEPKDRAGGTVAERPGCGELCQQAGPPAGTDNPGCPGNDSDNCAPCPKGGCAEVLTASAHARDGIFNVDMACKVERRCSGALHVYVPGSISDPIAASDVSVKAGGTTSVPIALTGFGRRVVGATGRFQGSIYVFLKGTGIDDLGARDFTSRPTLRLSAAKVELPSCGRGLEVASNTSCPFAKDVAARYAEGAMAFKAHSPPQGGPTR
jgi:hypothetical protein